MVGVGFIFFSNCVRLTSNNKTIATKITTKIKINNIITKILPTDKINTMKKLQDEKQMVAMIGDGVNDATTLTQTNLGLNMSTETDVAIEASDLTLVRDDLRTAADAIQLSHNTLRTIKNNLF